MNSFFAFVSALIFGAGLAISGMIDPAKVQGFLDFTGRWDPSLAFVMGGALAVTSVGYALLAKRGEGFGGVRLSWPTRNDVNARLICGAALFGAGWGLAGYCPGPAIGSLAFGGAEALVFVGVMVAALWATTALVDRR